MIPPTHWVKNSTGRQKDQGHGVVLHDQGGDYQ